MSYTALGEFFPDFADKEYTNRLQPHCQLVKGLIKDKNQH